MAYDTSALTKASVRGALRKEILARVNNPTGDRGFFYMEGSLATAPTTYDTNGEHMELLQFPDNCRLLGCWVSSDTSMDTHATPTLENDLAIVDSAHAVETTLVESSTLFRTAGATIAWGPAATFGGFEYPGLDVGGKYLAVVTDASAATPATTTTFTFGVFVYMGSAVDLGNG